METSCHVTILKGGVASACDFLSFFFSFSLLAQRTRHGEGTAHAQERAEAGKQTPKEAKNG